MTVSASSNLAPPPSSAPIVNPKDGMGTWNWIQWFVAARVKINAINTSIANLAGTSGTPGILVTDGNGNWLVRSLAAGTNISIVDADGVLGNPTIASSGGGGAPITITSINVSSYTATASDAPASSSNVGWIDQQYNSTNIVNIDTNANQNFPIGTHLYIRQAGTGVTSINALPGVVFTGPTITGGGQGSVGELVQISINNWAVFGDLAWTSIVPYYSVVMADSPIAYYRLGETSGTVAADSSGNGYNGTYEGGVTLGSPSLILNNVGNLALGGNGTNVYVNVGGPSTLYGLNRNFSIEAWIKPNFTASGQASGIWSSGLSGVCIRCDWNGTNIQIELLSDYAASLNTWTTTIGNNTTTHVVLTCTSTGVCTLYINGVAFGSTYTATNTFTGAGVVVGGDSNYPSTPGTFLFGEIDEVAAYNTCLTSARVLAHYNAGV